MALLDRIQKDMVSAMKSREEARLSALRMIKTALTKHQADTARPLDEAAEMKVLNMLLKQRQDAIEMFRKGGRDDLAAKEEAEQTLIESYLPAPATGEEMDAAVAEAIAGTGAASAKQMGLVMKAAQALLAGRRVDGKALSEKVKARLA